MIATSERYNEDILASARTNVFKATFGFVPPGAVEGSTLSASEQAPQSQLLQIKNEINNAPVHWEHLSWNSWLLDGNANIPRSLADEVGEYGFWSANQSNAEGVFDNPPYVIYSLDADYSLIGITVSFAEIPTAFTVQYLDDLGVVVAEKTLADNREQNLVIDLIGDNVRSIKIIINSWVLPYRRAKLIEMLPGQIFTFDNSNTIQFEYLENVGFFNNSYNSPQFEIEFDNSDKRFDMLNPTGIFAYLYREMGIKASIGTLLADSTIEYVPMGNFYVYEIPANQQRETATLVCRPLIALGDNLTYPTDHKDLSTISEVVARIFEVAGSTENYYIDESLADIVCNGYCGEDVKLVDAFAMIATACAGYWQTGRNGEYYLKPIESILNASEGIAGTLDYDNSLSKPEISANRITSVKISYSYFKTYSSSEGYSGWTTETTVHTAEVDDGGSVQIACPFIRYKEQAENVANVALRFYNHYLNFNSKYRGNPALQAGDIVNLQTDYGSLPAVIEDVKITFDNKEFLQSELKGRG